MATTMHRDNQTESEVPTVSVTRREEHDILDRQAWKYLGMSGEEFARRYRAGQIPAPDRSEVARVAMLLPYADR